MTGRRGYSDGLNALAWHVEICSGGIVLFVRRPHKAHSK